MKKRSGFYKRAWILLLLLPNMVRGTEYTTFIIAGQSNAQGYGYAGGGKIRTVLKPNTNLADLDRSDLLINHPDVRIFSGAVDSGTGQWKDLAPGCGISWKGTRFGPELSFGHAIQKALGGKVALIKYAKGGTSLAERFDGEQKDVNDWYLQDNVDNQYDFFIQTWKASLAAAKEQGNVLEVQGMLWMQGEADSREPEYAKAYKANLAAFIAAVRKDLNLPELPFYLGALADSPAWKYRETIWAAQQAIAEADAHVFVVNAKDLPLFENDGDNCRNIHYTTQGQVMLGERFADAVLSSRQSGE